MPAPFHYKVKPGDLWSSIASLFKVPQQAIIQANPGVSRLSTGMQIKLPQYNPPVIPALTTPSITPPAIMQFGQNSITPPAIMQFGQTSQTFVQQTPYVQVGTGGKPTGNEYGTEYGRHRDYVPPPTSPMNIPRSQNANPYSSLFYERDPLTGLARRDSSGRSLYNYVPVYQNGQQMIGRNGQPIVTARSIYVRDAAAEAAAAGVTYAEYTEALHESGYTLFGGMWVYVGNSSPDAPNAAAGGPVRAFYRVGRGRDKWVTTEQAAASARRRRGQHYQERMEYRNEQERRKKEGEASEGSLNVNFGVGAG